MVGSPELSELTEDERVQLLERRAARAAQLEAQLSREAETLTAELTAAILARKTASESAMKGRKQNKNLFSAFTSPTAAKPKKK